MSLFKKPSQPQQSYQPVSPPLPPPPLVPTIDEAANRDEMGRKLARRRGRAATRMAGASQTPSVALRQALG